MSTVRFPWALPSLLAGFCFALLFSATHCSGKEEEKPREAVVKPLTLSALRVAPVRGGLKKPTVIESAKQLFEAVQGDGKARALLAKQVDFTKQKVLMFRWSGSGQDKLKTSLAKGKEGQIVVFTYSPGRTRDLRPHVHLFAIEKGTPWRLERGK